MKNGLSCLLTLFHLAPTSFDLYICQNLKFQQHIIEAREIAKQASTKYSRNGLFCNSFISCFAMAI